MLDANDIYEKLTLAGNDWAIKNGNAELLEETKKTVLWSIASIFEGSVASKEAMALASDGYREHVEKMVEARKQANIAKIEYESRKAWLDIMRTNAATERLISK